MFSSDLSFASNIVSITNMIIVVYSNIVTHIIMITIVYNSIVTNTILFIMVTATALL